jgi:hypothetical protein
MENLKYRCGHQGPPATNVSALWAATYIECPECRLTESTAVKMISAKNVRTSTWDAFTAYCKSADKPVGDTLSLVLADFLAGLK